ncbi:transmembrane 9 superfamily member 8-like [Iris pallida]|uniref:Transmembrane 9 superfamily member 8-like n=1 Tax=Iris pallida TaxID=29817 RepID=A0AAX6HE82_IRIPA|nr:transmembrane 9 superfamily member 8-like [Iris pallida]
MREKEIHHIVCKITLTEKDAKDLKENIEEEYRVNIVKPEYEGEWDGCKTHLSTCDSHAKHAVMDSEMLQEVEEKNDVIFTYDVEFKVFSMNDGLLSCGLRFRWFVKLQALVVIWFVKLRVSVMGILLKSRTLVHEIGLYIMYSCDL